MEKIPTIAWCIPVNRDIKPRIYQNHLGALSYTIQRSIARIEHFIMPVGRIIDKARNMTALAAVKEHVDYLFWVDQDVKIWPHAIEKLLLHNKHIVGGLYFLKEPPYHPCIFTHHVQRQNRYDFTYIDDYRRGLNPVDLTGFGCMLIKASVFEDLPYPWFRLIKANTTEDVYFCKQAQTHGYNVWVDANVKCKHLGESAEIGEQDFILNTKSQGDLNEK